MNYTNITKLVIIGDVHFGINKNNITKLNFQLEYFERLIIPQIKNLKQQGEVPLVIFLGDIFDHRQLLHLKVLNKAKEILKKICDLCYVDIIVGNHDVFYLNSNSISSPNLFSFPNLRIFTSPVDVMVGGIMLSMIPWEHNNKKLQTNIANAKGRLAFTHCDINNFKLNSHMVIDYGLNTNTFLKFEYVYNGHIHLNQTINNILNVGCILHLNRNDVGDTKGFYIYDIKSNTNQFIINDISPQYKWLFLHKLTETQMQDELFIKSIVENSYIDVYLKENHNINQRILINLLTYINNYALSSDITNIEDNDDIDIDIDVNSVFKNFKNDSIIKIIVSKYLDTLEESQNLKTRLLNDFYNILDEIKNGIINET